MTDVLVGIPTLNGSARLKRCLESIAECTRFGSFECVTVLVCDDGSTEEDLVLNKNVIHDASRRVPGLEMLVNGKREGIASSWNKLVRHRDSDIVVLINDDIEVVEHWLDVLVYSVAENSIAGMVGLNSYVGAIKAQTQPPLRVDYNEAALQFGGGTLLASHGPIFAFRREAYNLVGGFDERYFCFYEELDFGVSLHKKGLRHFMASYPIVYHMGGATNSDPRNLIAREELERSRAKFIDKWKATPEELRQAMPLERKPPFLNEWHVQRNNWK
jgi:GT2 family glycosyltransferase